MYLLHYFFRLCPPPCIALFPYTTLFRSKKRYITLNKIQSIQEDKTLLHRMFGLTSLTIVTGTTGDNASVKLDALIPEDAEELNELLKREVETNIVNDNEHTLKEDQKTTHHYSMSFKIGRAHV